MSSSIATRTTRFTPPAPPTRKAGSRRTVSGPGACVAGRADRPVLRIVVDDERAPVFTRVAPTALPSVEPDPTLVEPVETSLVEPVETPLRRVRLDDFFAAEYDGDDQRLEVAPPRRSTVRLTRRGRLVVLGARPRRRARPRLLRRLGLDRERPPRADPRGHRPARPDPVGHLVPRGRHHGQRRRALDDEPPRGDQPPRLRHPPGRPAPPRAEVGRARRAGTHELPQTASTPVCGEPGKNGGRRQPHATLPPAVPPTTTTPRPPARFGRARPGPWRVSASSCMQVNRHFGESP